MHHGAHVPMRGSSLVAHGALPDPPLGHGVVEIPGRWRLPVAALPVYIVAAVRIVFPGCFSGWQWQFGVVEPQVHVDATLAKRLEEDLAPDLRRQHLEEGAVGGGIGCGLVQVLV